MTAPSPAGLKVCIVAHMAYGALSGSGGHIGGVERQTSLLSRWLARRGHHVTMITWDEGQPRPTVIDQVRVVTTCRESDGWPVARFFHPRWSSLVRALRAADADVYYQNCAEYVTGQVALWCRANRRGFVYASASDSDCDARLPLLTTRRERVLYRAGLRRADRIIVQTESQRAMLRRNFGHDATVIPMPGADYPEVLAPSPAPQRVVWIGRVCEVKRPDRLLDLAARRPDVPFELIGPSDGTAYATSVLARAAERANVHVHGALPPDGVRAALSGARCLISTSDIEGFPNTFLEAWSYGVPVVSTIDPDGVIARHGLGWVAPSPDDLHAQLGEVLASPQERDRAGTRAREYFLRNHAADAVLPRFERVLAEAAGSRR